MPTQKSSFSCGTCRRLRRRRRRGVPPKPKPSPLISCAPGMRAADLPRQSGSATAKPRRGEVRGSADRPSCVANWGATRPEFHLSRRATFTLLNGDTAAGGPAFSAFFHGAHSAFGLRANAEAGTADDHTDPWRRGPFLNDPASLRGRFLNDVKPPKRPAATKLRSWRVQAGAVKLPGLFEVPRHSGVRTLLASYKPRRTPSASKSLV
jgi:hypothetical protein